MAYLYRGADNRVMTIVNISRGALTTNIRLRETETDAVWEDLLNPGVTLATGGMLLGNVALEGDGDPERGLRVFLRVQ